MNGIETYSFGEWLKQRREQLRLTQRELAAGAHCSLATIKKIEADERRPSVELASSLAGALNIPNPDQDMFVEVARGERPVDLLWQVQVRDGKSPVSMPFHAPVPLPTPATPFVGRANELAQIGELLASPTCRLVTLVGPGGIGKTRLATTAARAHQSAFADGVAFVSLAAITDSTMLPGALAKSLRLSLSGSPAHQVEAYLRRRSLLLIVDNCEQLEGDLTWLSELLDHAPGLKILATSRERLHLAEEWIYAVPELGQAADLFVATARRIKQDFDAQAEWSAILRICQLVENLPLAVELSAGWTHMMSCGQIADHIQRDIDILATDVRNIPERHRSVKAVFDHSWKLLSTIQQAALMQLSVFRGGWQAEEASYVAGAALPLLRELVDKSLVRVGVDGRYDLHELIRQYAAVKLTESGAENETQRRQFDAYLKLAAQLDVRQTAPRSMEAVARFEQEQDNFRAALGWGLANEKIEATLQLINHLGFYWIRRGYWREGEQWAIRAIHQAGEYNSVSLAMVLSHAATCAYIQGRFGKAESLALRSMAIARHLESPDALIFAHFTHTFASANAEQALNELQAAITLVEETGKWQVALPGILNVAAAWLYSSGRYIEAREYYQKSINLYRQADATDSIAEPLIRFGQLALHEGHLQEAHDLTVESIAAMHASGNYEAFGGRGLAQLGAIQLYMGESAAAEKNLEEALPLLDDEQQVLMKQGALAILSEVMLTQGDVTKAANYLEASLDICRGLYRQLQATQKLEGTAGALPIDFVELCARASLVAAAQGEDERAVTLYSIAESLRLQSGQAKLPPSAHARLEEAMVTIRARLPADAFDGAWESGEGVSLSEAIAFVLA